MHTHAHTHTHTHTHTQSTCSWLNLCWQDWPSVCRKENKTHTLQIKVRIKVNFYETTCYQIPATSTNVLVLSAIQNIYVVNLLPFFAHVKEILRCYKYCSYWKYFILWTEYTRISYYVSDVSALIFMPQYVINTNLLCYCSSIASEFMKCLTVSDKFNLHHIKRKYFKLNPIKKQKK